MNSVALSYKASATCSKHDSYCNAKMICSSLHYDYKTYLDCQHDYSNHSGWIVVIVLLCILSALVIGVLLYFFIRNRKHRNKFQSY